MNNLILEPLSISEYITNNRRPSLHIYDVNNAYYIPSKLNINSKTINVTKLDEWEKFIYQYGFNFELYGEEAMFKKYYCIMLKFKRAVLDNITQDDQDCICSAVYNEVIKNIIQYTYSRIIEILMSEINQSCEISFYKYFNNNAFRIKINNHDASEFMYQPCASISAYGMNINSGVYLYFPYIYKLLLHYRTDNRKKSFDIVNPDLFDGKFSIYTQDLPNTMVINNIYNNLIITIKDIESNKYKKVIVFDKYGLKYKSISKLNDLYEVTNKDKNNNIRIIGNNLSLSDLFTELCYYNNQSFQLISLFIKIIKL